MSLRMAALATFIAALPLSVELPADSTARRGQTRLEVAGSRSQYGIVTRGCDDRVLTVVHNQLRSGALVIEHETPDGVVIGVRGGEVHERLGTGVDTYNGATAPTVVRGRATNRYVNPFVALEGEEVGIGAGWLKTEHEVPFGQDRRTRADVSAHLRIGPHDGGSLTIRLYEDVPLLSQGTVSADFTVHTPRIDVGPSIGLAGPYDGTLLGLHGRVWFTPFAAATIRAAVAHHGQYNVSGGFTACWPTR